MTNDDSNKKPDYIFPYLLKNQFGGKGQPEFTGTRKSYFPNGWAIEDFILPTPERIMIHDDSHSIPDPLHSKSESWRNTAGSPVQTPAQRAYGSRGDDAPVFDPFQLHLPFPECGGQYKLPPAQNWDADVEFLASFGISPGWIYRHLSSPRKGNRPQVARSNPCVGTVFPLGKSVEPSEIDAIIIPLETRQNNDCYTSVYLSGLHGTIEVIDESHSIPDPVRHKSQFSKGVLDILFPKPRPKPVGAQDDAPVDDPAQGHLPFSR